MQILSITPHTSTYTTGRLSDGSDRQTVTITEYLIIVQDGGGKYEATLQTDDQQAIEDAYADGLFNAIPLNADERIAQLEAELVEAKRENLTALEAIADLYELYLGAG